MRLLVVEDNAAQVISYRDAISALNVANAAVDTDPIVLTSAASLAEAMEALKAGAFDAAVVDLKLSGQQAETEGNDVIREIVSIKRFPIFVYSAHLGDIDDAIAESVFFQKFEKTGGTTFTQIVEQLQGIYKTGITKILGNGGSIETRLTEIFWKNIAGSFGSLIGKDIKEEQLLRYIAGHLYEHLELNGVDGFDEFMPEEVYIQPSIKTDFFTGSIIKNKESEKYYIILTPQCDMAIAGKTTTILAAEIDMGILEDLKAKLKRTGPPAGTTPEQFEEQNEKARGNIEKLLRNNHSPKYYFLPKSHWFDGGLIHFQDLFPVTPAQISAQFDLIAAISAPFLRDIVSRFAHYYSRQGSPDLKYSIDDFLA
jgi:CheY-like chemotaxis protein